jgi:hypothetical protein
VEAVEGGWVATGAGAAASGLGEVRLGESGSAVVACGWQDDDFGVWLDGSPSDANLAPTHGSGLAVASEGAPVEEVAAAAATSCWWSPSRSSTGGGSD